MNTYPTTGEKLYMEQKKRDLANPGCIEYARNQAICNKYPRKLTKVQEKKREEQAIKLEKDEIAGYKSRRYDFPEYHWWMMQDGKKYLRSSKNLNVYDYVQSSVIVGTWNEVSQRIEFINGMTLKIKELEKIIANLTEIV
jgi:hypothetical protein